MSLTTVGHVELFVKDARVSARFYVDVLGFELEADQGAIQPLQSLLLDPHQ